MGFLLSRIFVFLTVSELSRNGGKPCAALPVPPPQLYWNSVLPNTPMPKSLSQLVKPDENALKYSKGADENAPFRYSNGADGNPPFKYSKDGSENVTRAIFVSEKDLHLGTTMNYLLAGNSSITIPFLSRNTVELIPFSSSKLPEILNKFSVKPESEAADMINNTIQGCELQGARNEAKQCAASLESMIDFATSTLGKNALAIATEVDKKGADLKQKYTITIPGVKELAGNKFMLCHKMSYPYAVFYCHAIEKTRTYMVPLQGTDGTRAKAVAACHENTSERNPNHYAFKELKVEPGTVPIYHFLEVEDVIWVPNQKPT
ncbi:hypothetical protein FF1_019784 [Malus domestica]